MNDELFEAMSEFIDSCHRNGKHDKEDNIGYFLSENDGLDHEEVRDCYDSIDSNY